jgi:hypothetical protein
MCKITFNVLCDTLFNQAVTAASDYYSCMQYSHLHFFAPTILTISSDLETETIMTNNIFCNHVLIMFLI